MGSDSLVGSSGVIVLWKPSEFTASGWVLIDIYRLNNLFKFSLMSILFVG